jgi:RinA family phage transcriptional activator
MRIRTNNPRRANFKLIECELYNYHDTKKEIEELKDDMYNETILPEVAVQSAPGNITQSKALRVCSSKVLREMEERVKAIDYALRVWAVVAQEEPNKLKLVQMKYFERQYTDMGIWKQLNIDDRTFRRWRRDFIQLIADKLGWEI